MVRVRVNTDDLLKLSRGRRIRILRQIHGLTQEQLAHQIGVSKGSVSSWEKNEWSPEDEHCWRLAVLFDVPVSVIAAPPPPAWLADEPDADKDDESEG